ncbi:MAG: alpha/beta hydrolase [Saprospirales bacterium]|nr:alpha/beta hydrolase [Saprospirales bacterium]
MLAISTAFLLGCVLVAAGVLWAYSPGKLKPYTDDRGDRLPNSLAEKVFLSIGNVKQGMFITSKDTHHPVLLYVHGGPAFPNYFLIDKFQPGLEDYFTVCYWEQRGGGLSYTPDVTLESMNLDQLASDAIEVANYLRDRFGQEKIYLMAHSGGSAFSLEALSRQPEIFHAYLAMAQITHQAESEKIAYRYMLDHFTKAGNKRAVRQLKEYPVEGSAANVALFYRSAARDQYMHELGIGTMHQMHSIFWDIFVPVWTCKAYTLREKVNIWKSKFSFLPKTGLMDEILFTDLPAKYPRLDVPVYFFSGKYDLTANVDLSKAYFEKLQAPLKRFYFFENSAHSPLYEEPGKMRQIIERDILGEG